MKFSYLIAAAVLCFANSFAHAGSCSAGQFEPEIRGLIAQMNARTEAMIRTKMNSIVIGGQVLGYREGSFRVDSGRLHMKDSQNPNGAYAIHQDNEYKFQSASGENYSLIYWDLMGGRRLAGGFLWFDGPGSFDINEIGNDATIRIFERDVNTSVQSCQIQVNRNTRGVPLMLLNVATKYGYFLKDEEAKDVITAVLPAR